jgi:hypothetical protein
MKTTQAKPRNPYRQSAATTLRNEGVDPGSDDSVFEYLRTAQFQGTAPACCTEGCIVEPDGTCSHGCPSVLLVIGLI